MRTARHGRYAFAAALALALCMGSPAHASSADTDEAVLATKAAMDAFFRLPDALPPHAERALDQPTLSEFLVLEMLEAQAARGARWDAYRHQGTMLHHSLRAGTADVTRWLLDHGADPLQRIQGDGNLDALGVAVRMERWEQVSLLLRHPAYRALPRAALAARIWDGADTPEHRAVLLKMKPRLPMPSANGKGKTWLEDVLCTADLPVARRFAASGSAPIALEAYPRCASEAQPRRLDFQAWKSLEPRFSRPLLPYLARQLRNEADLRRALSSGLRQPWRDSDFAKAMLEQLQRPLLAALLLSDQAGSGQGVRSSSRADLWRQLQHHQAVHLWDVPLPMWSTLIGRASPEGLRRLAGAGTGMQPTAARAGHWDLLMAHLAALPASQRPEPAVLEALPKAVPVSQLARALDWAQAADRGPEAVAAWLWQCSAPALVEAWPLLQQHAAPHLPQLLAGVLAPLRAEPASDRLGRAIAVLGLVRDGLAKARFLRSQGLQAASAALAARHLPRHAGEVPAWDMDGESLVRWALQEQLLMPVDAASASAAPVTDAMQAPVRAEAAAEPPSAAPEDALYLVSDPPDCTALATPALRQSLADRSLKASAGDLPEGNAGWGTLQPVAGPGPGPCHWLRSSVEIHGGGWTDRSFFTGEEYHPAWGSLEQVLHVSRWAEAQGHFVDIKDLDFASGLQEVEFRPGGVRFWMASGSDVNGTRPARAMTLRWQGQTLLLEEVPENSALAFRWQRLLNAPEAETEALEAPKQEAQAEEQRFPREAQGIADFADAQWAAERESFLRDFAEFQREALEAHAKAGLFAHWLNEAVLALSAQDAFSLAQRRERMAWMLAESSRAASLSEKAVQSLVEWLPAEDWDGVLLTWRCVSEQQAHDRDLRRQLERLVQNAPEALRYRIEVALARECNGEIK